MFSVPEPSSTPKSCVSPAREVLLYQELAREEVEERELLEAKEEAIEVVEVLREAVAHA